MGHMRLMVPFIVLLLMVPFFTIPASAGPVAEVPQPEFDWSGFWVKFNKYSDWDLEWYNGGQWVSVKSDLRVVRDYPEPNRVKLTLIFDASHAGNYRLTFAISKVVKDYVTRLGQFQYELDYENHSIVWDWSDAVSIPGIVFNHGVQDGFFWFRMRRDSVPLGAHVEIDPTLIASNTGASDYTRNLQDLHPSASPLYSAWYQSFVNVGTEVNLTSAQFYMRKIGTPTGNAVAVLYAHAGVYGTSSVPTGPALATSSNFDVSTLTGAFAYTTFTFPAGQRYGMQPGEHYVIAVQMPGVGVMNTTDYVQLRSTLNVYGGSEGRYANGAWTVQGATDALFRVYADYPPTIDSYVCDTLFDATNQGWFNVTVSDVDLVADLTTIDIAVTIASNNTFTLRWTQATGVFSEVADPDAVCTLNTTDSIRVNVDANTDEICFLFGISAAADEGNADVVVTATDDYGVTDVEIYAAAFVFSVFDWNPLADLLDSLFALFGITGFVTQITTFINGISTFFSTSLTNIVTLVGQQFQFIAVAFNTLTYWFGLVLGTVLDFIQFGRDIMDGVSGYFAWMGNLWDWIGWNVWAPVLPLYIFLRWIMSIPERANTTSGGEIQVLINDFNTVASLISYFLGVFSFIISTVYQYVTSLLGALT